MTEPSEKAPEKKSSAKKWIRRGGVALLVLVTLFFALDPCYVRQPNANDDGKADAARSEGAGAEG